MNDNIAAIIIPGSNLSNNKCRNGDIDIIMFSLENVYFNIKNDDEFVSFKENIDNYNYDLKDKLVYHIDFIKNYFKKEFKRETNGFNLDRFNPSNALALYKVLASAGNIIILNSEYVLPIFLPENKKITDEQIESLSKVSELIEDINIDSIFIDTRYNEIDEYDGNFSDFIEYINNQRKARRY
jgi:hypothetical protein